MASSSLYSLWLSQVHPSWHPLGVILEELHFKKIHIDFLFSSSSLVTFPLKTDIFKAFSLPLQDIKVVLLGQDPYHHMESGVPAATGLSFSVPLTHKLPSSLRNIYMNLISYNHTTKSKITGDLTFLLKQGVLLLNTSLTVSQGRANSHTHIWKNLTDCIIQYISENTTNIVFLLFGSPALSKLPLIDVTKHHPIISSHPSGLSCHTPLKTYPAFMNLDFLTITNEYLKKYNKQPIVI